MRRLHYLLIAIAIAGVAAGYAFWQQRGSHGGAAAFVTETVERGTITSAVTATGTVNPVTTVQVGTYVSGPILAIDVDYNSRVRKGQRVAKIDPASFQVKVQGAEASLANARAKVEKDRADLELKRLTVERYRELRGRDLVSQNDLDSAQSNYDQAVAQLALDRAGVKQAEADLAEARINLGYTDIVSPVDGVVVSRNVDVGQTVAASFQTPTLFLIAQDLTKMQVDANVSESDIGLAHDGQTARFTVDAYPGRPFTGTVVQVRNAPINVQNVVTYDVVIAVDNSSLALKPGMTANVTIIAAERENVVKVSIRALSFNPKVTHTPAAGTDHGGERGSAVWKLDAHGALQRVAIETGIRDDQDVEVVSGDVEAGDKVVVGLSRGGVPQSPAARPPGFGPRMR